MKTKKQKSTSLTRLYVQSFICLSLLLTPFQSIFSHGTVTSPPSRVWICFQENPESPVWICFQENPESPDSPACQAAVIGWGTQALYDWSEVARMDAGGMHQIIIGDGELASGTIYCNMD